MSFPSQYAPKIWNYLYDVEIPDELTLNPDYVKLFGVTRTGIKEYDTILANQFIHVKIPIIKIVEYFLAGIEVRIKGRDKLIEIYKNVTGYLEEWRAYLRYHINHDEEQYRELLTSLEKFAKYLHDKLGTNELLDQLFIKKSFGIENPLVKKEKALELKDLPKPKYEGLSKLTQNKKPKFGIRKDELPSDATTTRY